RMHPDGGRRRMLAVSVHADIPARILLIDGHGDLVGERQGAVRDRAQRLARLALAPARAVGRLQRDRLHRWLRGELAQRILDDKLAQPWIADAEVMRRALTVPEAEVLGVFLEGGSVAMNDAV